MAENTAVDDNTYMIKKNKTAMLDLLISAKKEGLIDDIGIQEEVDTFMFEGHDTTASGLTFCFMLLAHHKDVQEKIFAEIKEIVGDSKRSITIEDLSKMKYLERCIKESLRLYPPVHLISRKLKEDMKLSQKFAMMEMKVAMAEVLREFTLEPVTHPDDIRIIADVVLRNDGPIEVTFVKRQ
ncbi:hypothetical protein PYW07_007306 [Mythimna separata]|uniref:Cytochrome P450 n=1 Tax=Mythimna separata TaxID=271217 RepID=A0AAD8E1B5_MYTSE|nr:hypothetical protein PYW07_007306 [Mythimna separata]